MLQDEKYNRGKCVLSIHLDDYTQKYYTEQETHCKNLLIKSFLFVIEC